MSRLRSKLADRGGRQNDMRGARRAISFLSKVSGLISMDADDGDFERYQVKNTNPEGDSRDYSDIRERDIQSGLDMAWDSNRDFAPGSETGPVPAQNASLQSRSQGQKYAADTIETYRDLVSVARFYTARVKESVQSNNVMEGEQTYPESGGQRAELTDDQQTRVVSEHFDSVQDYAPLSDEGGKDEPFGWSAHEKAGSELPSNHAYVEDEEARGLPQWPDVTNDSRDAGQGDEPTSRAWSEHDSFNVTDMPTADAQGNPGPST